MKKLIKSESGSVEIALALVIAAFIVGVIVAYNGVALMWVNVGF